MIPRNGKTLSPVVLSGFVSYMLLTMMPNAFAEPVHDKQARGKPLAAPVLPEPAKVNSSKTESGQPQPSAEVDKYCANIATNTNQAANLLHEQQLHELESQIELRIKELDAKRSEVQRLIDTNEAMLAKANQSLVDLYSKMKPDAAASQIAKLDDDIAVALLVHVKTKEMSAIMDEMEPERAAAFTKKLIQKIRAQKEEKAN
jgi:flagellar motility protein MotE (MotC chaperone)